MTPIYRPYLHPEATKYAYDAIASGWVSSRGPYVELATELLKSTFGYKYVVLTCNGTAAGHLVAIALRACRPDVRRIIVPNNVYVAAWNTLLQEYPPEALHAIDADIRTWTADLSGRSFDVAHEAVLAVHNVSGVFNVAALRKRHPGLEVLEDNCEGLFGRYDGMPTGTMAFASSLSFFANKTITSGEGGAFVTSDERAYEVAKAASDQGSTHERYVHDQPGYNYRMTNVQAALLYGQLVRRYDILDKKTSVFAMYQEMLPTDRVLLQASEDGTAPANWMMGVRVVGNSGYAAAESFMKERGVEIRPMFPPITRHAHLRAVRTTGTAVAEILYRECFLIPSYPDLSVAEQMTVVDAVHDYARSL